MDRFSLSFNAIEILSLFGLAQCVYILVYMVVRSGRLSRGILPACFFLILSGAFFLSAAQGNLGDHWAYYRQFQWLLWTACAPMSVLLIIQIARVTELPPLKYYNLLLLLPIAYFCAVFYAESYGRCETLSGCEAFFEWLEVLGLILSTITLLTIWVNREVIDGLKRRKNGKERFWLIMALILMNIFLLFVTFGQIYDVLGAQEGKAVRILVGIAFAYVASTSLFRIYPHAVYIKPRHKGDKDVLSDRDIKVAMKVETLLYRDNVYQDAGYNRAKMAQELDMAESQLSRVVNLYFEKSVPKLLNELRVAEAKSLLLQTDADIAALSEEVGFNSLATFNRVFKDMTGLAPGQFRDSKGKK